MAHLHERKEKVCLNCNTILVGRYCQDCGQENLEPKENFRHILHHFVEDVTHFDGKLFNTVKLLLTKPGFLTEEYMKGRRASYLNPIRMYLFVSAVFFIVLFTLFERKLLHNTFEKTTVTDTVYTDANVRRPASPEGVTTLQQYEVQQAALPVSKRDNHIEAFINRRMVALVEYINKDKDGFMNITISVLHTLPKIMFITMPLLALIFYVVYYKERDTYYYVAHGIFTLHYTTTQFLILLIATPFALIPVVGPFIALAIFITIPIYMFMAMRRFYKQGSFKTFMKFNNVMLLYNVVTFALLVLFITGYLLSSQYLHY